MGELDNDDEEDSRDPKKDYKKWNKELTSAKKWFKNFHKNGKEVGKVFLGNKGSQGDAVAPDYLTPLNLFHANIVTLKSMLYGRIPKVEVSRRFADADDDTARVAGVILTRILNTDIEVAGEDLACVYRSGLEDRLLPGLGTARLQYQCESHDEEVPAITDPTTGIEQAPAYTKTVKENEWVDTVYTHWQDELWSPARTSSEIRWKAYRSYMTKKEVKARFPDCDIDRLSFSSKGPLNTGKYDKEADTDPQVEIWEIWDKTERCLHWYSEGYEEMLEYQDDILGLDGFFPEAPPMISNTTTSKYLPVSDYSLAKQLYDEIDVLETRLTYLTRACKLVGVYDKKNTGVIRLFDEGTENDLIAVDNWAAFSEAGGLDGAVQWLPLKDVVEAINNLTMRQKELIAQLMQITGMNDVMRGAAEAGGTPVSATERKIQANYGSIRIEALQNEFARWVSDSQSIKAEIISKHYDPESIITQSNILATPDGQDQQVVQAAVQLIKNTDISKWRITVRPETLAIADYAQLKQDRVEFLMGISQFLQSSAPMIEAKPEAAPFLMKMMKWSMAGFRGASEIEGVMDQAISALEKQPPQPKQDPAMIQAQAKKEQIQMEMAADQRKQQQEMIQDQQKFAQDMKQNQQEFLLKMQQQREEHALELQQTKADIIATIQKEFAQMKFNTQEKQNAADIQEESDNRRARRDSKDKAN